MAIWSRFTYPGLKKFNSFCRYPFGSIFNNRPLIFIGRSMVSCRNYSVTSVINKYNNSLSVLNHDLNWNRFTSNLTTILNERNDSSTTSKLFKLYKTIESQYQLCSNFEVNNNNNNGKKKNIITIFLPDIVHFWFYQNLSKDQIYNHINNMILWNVNLSSSIYSKRLVHKLLQSSEFDIQLITLEKFLSDNCKQSNTTIEISNIQNVFTEKFISIYDWDTMILLTNNVIKRGNWKFVPYYLTALIGKLNQLQIKNYNNSGSRSGSSINQTKIDLKRSFLKFLVELMTVLSNLNNHWNLVLPVFKLIIESFNNLTLSLSTSSSSSSSSLSMRNLSILNKPLLQILKLLRINGQNDEIFQIVSYLNNKHLNSKDGESRSLLSILLTSFQFQKRLLLELLTTLRSFNDPKLSVQFLLASVKSPDMKQILNDLGLLGWIFNREVSRLDPLGLQLLLENGSSNQFANINLKFKIDDLAPILSELYLVVLRKNSMTLTQHYNKDVLLKLYYNYINKLNSSINSYYLWKNDSGVLIHFLKNIIFEIKDHQLAYNILLDFYSQKLAKRVRIVSSKNKNITTTNYYTDSYANNNCPFTLLIQASNKFLSMNQISKLLNIMQIHHIPLNFNVCCSIVLKFIYLKRYSDAKLWYEKLHSGNFNVDHFILLYYVRKFDWPLPKNVNYSTITEIDDLLKKGLSPQRLHSNGNHMIHTDKDINNQNRENFKLEDDLEPDVLFMDRQEPDEAIFKELSTCLAKLDVK